jgi:hypothetical protein
MASGGWTSNWPAPQRSVMGASGLQLTIGALMTARKVRHRRSAALSQANRCYYCLFPMCEAGGSPLRNRHRLSRQESALLRCTAEHLKARSEGGTDAAKNIVAAHLYCNQARHQTTRALPPEQYKDWVRDQVRRGHWLTARLCLPGSTSPAAAWTLRGSPA